jgi:hypothetical protein
MAAFDQPITTYSDTLGQKRVIGDVIQMIDPRDTPLVSLIGLDSARSKFRLNLNGTKIEVLEDALDPLTGTVGATTIATDSVTFVVVDASNFAVGQVILIDAEYMVISAVNVTTNVLTVAARNYGGTSGVTHTCTSAVAIVGMARLEGADADFGPILAKSAPFNYTSIFQKGVKASGTEQVIDQYGYSDEFDYQSAKSIPHLLRLVERMFFYGIKQAGTAVLPRSAGGLATFISTNSTSTTAINRTNLDAAALAVRNVGGSPDLFVCNPAIAAAIRTLIDSSSFVKLTYENTRFGMNPTNEIMTQWGSLRIVDDRWCPLAQAYLLDSRKVGLYTLRPFFSHEISVTGDSVKGEVIGEFSLLVANESGMYKYTALAG